MTKPKMMRPKPKNPKKVIEPRGKSTTLAFEVRYEKVSVTVVTTQAPCGQEVVHEYKRPVLVEIPELKRALTNQMLQNFGWDDFSSDGQSPPQQMCRLLRKRVRHDDEDLEATLNNSKKLKRPEKTFTTG